MQNITVATMAKVAPADFSQPCVAMVLVFDLFKYVMINLFCAPFGAVDTIFGF